MGQSFDQTQPSMTADDKISPPRSRTITLSPWLVIVGAAILYGLTLNHWVSLKSLALMAQVTGWDWHPYPLKWRPEIMAPLFLVTTAPIRLLPASWQPAALNVFTALCAALTLGLLARSVRLLPHDRTREQRNREMGAHSLLSIRAAFLPALFAVLVLATQLTFWQNAIVATGEMLNLLVFAFIVLCLLEYRVSQNDKWLTASALVFGLGASNNWALVGFLPFYIFAILWIRGLIGFFNLRFLLRMALWGLAGLLLYFLIPILGAASGGQGSFALRFGDLLGRELGAQSYGLKIVPGWVALLAGVPSLLPLLFAGIKWPSFEGEISAVGNQLTRLMFNALHVACLALVLVTFFDFKYSPSVRMREMPVSFLTFYYLGALCVGYFSGFMLLVFASIRLPAWERRHPLTKIFNRILVGAVWVLSFAAPAVLVWQNYPHIRAGNSQALRQFADQTLDGLPGKTAIVLSDDPTRLYLLQADYERRGQRNNNIMIETESFPYREYITYLAGRHPELKSVMTTNLAMLPNVLSSDNLATFMQHVTRNYPVYYLHPSFGYYFEALYLKPRELVYELKPYTTNMTQPPPPTAAEIQGNQAFWAKLENGPLQALPELASLDSDNRAVSVDYAVALDFWGTELQKAGYLKEARSAFAEAVRLNTNNLIAAVNLQYNERLQKGDHSPIGDAVESVGKATYRYGLEPVLRSSGPPDEPDLDLELGEILAERGNLAQASILFQRRLQLLPGDPEAELAMAKTYVDMHQSAKALDLLHKIRSSPKIDPWKLTRCEAMAYIASGDYPMAEKVLHIAIEADPKDANRFATLVEYYRFRGLESMRARKDVEAARYFANALTNIDLELELLASSNQGSLDVPEALLKKAELEIEVRSYGAAVSTLGRILEIQPKNYTALLNRAVCEIQLKQFQAARDDFKEMGKILPHQAYLVEFGLAEVAAAEKNKAEEIDHLKRVIHSAPEESSEYQRATNRVNALEGH
jgi:tetratricopeptide (TPR) repeat protein